MWSAFVLTDFGPLRRRDSAASAAVFVLHFRFERRLEAVGVEPTSEEHDEKASTGIARLLDFRPARRQQAGCVPGYPTRISLKEPRENPFSQPISRRLHPYARQRAGETRSGLRCEGELFVASYCLLL